MRDAVKNLNGDPEKINPICPADLVIDHSVQVDFARTSDALAKNQNLEFERNKERFTFLKVSTVLYFCSNSLLKKYLNYYIGLVDSGAHGLSITC